MGTTELSWRAEEACLAAWPSSRQLLLEGWLLRASGGEIRRANSVNPIRGGSRDPGSVLETAEAVYGMLGQSSLFRVLSFVDGMDEALENAGYLAEGTTLTLMADMTEIQSSTNGSVEVTATPGADWLRARARLGAVDAQNSRIYEAMLGAILVPRAFAAARQDGEIVSLAFAVVQSGLAVVESVVTDPQFRQRGFGRQTVGHLLSWADAQGASAACLQVVADNPAALALYRSLGFDRELYRYHYRRKDLGGQGGAKP
jgi:N-acetylglutamate synthase